MQLIENTIRRFTPPFLLSMLIPFGLSCAPTISDPGLDLDQKPVDEPFLWAGEEMYFQVDISGFQNALEFEDALRAGLIAGHEMETEDGTRYIPVMGSAITVGFFGKVFPLNDKGDTYMEPGTLLPILANKELNERDKHKTFSVLFRPDSYDTVVTKVDGDETTVKTVLVPPYAYDALSWAYAMRRIPLTPGYKQSWVLWDGWKMSRIYITVVGEEKMWCPMGWFDTVRIDADREFLETEPLVGAIAGVPTPPYVIVKDGPFEAGSIWLTADRERRPIRVTFKVNIGEVNMLLSDYKPPEG